EGKVSGYISRRKTRRFSTSSCISSLFGVSRTIGKSRQRGSCSTLRKPATPICPLPMCSWRSTREPRGFFESLRCSATTHFRPLVESSCCVLAATQISAAMHHGERHTHSRRGFDLLRNARDRLGAHSSLRCGEVDQVATVGEDRDCARLEAIALTCRERFGGPLHALLDENLN